MVVKMSSFIFSLVVCFMRMFPPTVIFLNVNPDGTQDNLKQRSPRKVCQGQPNVIYPSVEEMPLDCNGVMGPCCSSDNSIKPTVSLPLPYI